MDEENIEFEAASESSDNSVSLDIALDDQPKEVPFKGLVSDPPFNLEQKQEETRSYLAFALAGIFALAGVFAITLIAVFIFIGLNKITSDDSKELIVLMLTTQSTIVGTALGFYFANK